MPSSLKLVATPIGNIRDISLRAMDEIKKAHIILAEDTRHSMNLISALGISLSPDCRLVSCNSHSEEQRIKVVVERLLANDQVVYICDAGCPVVSDPGSLLVQGVLAAGLQVEVIPGPSAHSTALMAAGIDTTRFAFLGFLPQKKLARKKLITSAADTSLALVIYESPRRVADLLTELFEILGPRRVVVARELTKIHETFHRGVLGSELSPPVFDKGEVVVVVESSAESCQALDEEALQTFIKNELKNNSAKDVAKLSAEAFNISKKDAYKMVLDIRI